MQQKCTLKKGRVTIDGKVLKSKESNKKKDKKVCYSK